MIFRLRLLVAAGVAGLMVEGCKPIVAFTSMRYAPHHPERAALEELASL